MGAFSPAEWYLDIISFFFFQDQQYTFFLPHIEFTCNCQNSMSKSNKDKLLPVVRPPSGGWNPSIAIALVRCTVFFKKIVLQLQLNLKCVRTILVIMISTWFQALW